MVKRVDHVDSGVEAVVERGYALEVALHEVAVCLLRQSAMGFD